MEKKKWNRPPVSMNFEVYFSIVRPLLSVNNYCTQLGTVCAFWSKSALLKSVRAETSLLRSRCYKMGPLYWTLRPLRNSCLKNLPDTQLEIYGRMSRGSGQM